MEYIEKYNETNMQFRHTFICNYAEDSMEKSVNNTFKINLIINWYLSCSFFYITNSKVDNYKATQRKMLKNWGKK